MSRLFLGIGGPEVKKPALATGGVIRHGADAAAAAAVVAAAAAAAAGSSPMPVGKPAEGGEEVYVVPEQDDM